MKDSRVCLGFGVLASVLFLGSTVRADLVVDGLTLWLEAGESNAIWDDAGFHPDEAGFSGFVARWDDLSGNGYHATSGGATGPRYVANSIGGLPALQFNGAEWLRTADGAQDFADGFTMWAVINQSGLAGHQMHVSFGNEADGQRRCMWFADHTDTFSFNGYNRDVVGSRSVVAGTPYIGLVSKQAGSNNVSLSLNGMPGGSGAPGLVPYTGTELTIGANNGTPPPAGEFTTGDIAEVLIYNRELTEEERTEVGTYLGDKYGIEYRLPPEPPQPELVGLWTFENGEELVDRTGNWGELTLNGATIVDGQLDLGVETWAIAQDYTGQLIREKTLVAWARLEDLNVRNGTILGIDHPTLDRFDSIVYAEREEYRWMAGSSFFRRTMDVMPFDENLTHPDLVQIAITYADANGNNSPEIVLYRNGEAIGEYEQGPIVQWEGGIDDAAALFGPRALINGTAHGWVDALVEEARIYNYALTADEVGGLFLEGPLKGGLYWDGLGDGDWGTVDAGTGNSRWLDFQGNAQPKVPDATTDAVVRENTVTIAQDREIKGLVVESGGVLVADNVSVEVVDSVDVQPGGTLTLGSGATVFISDKSTIDSLVGGEGATLVGHVAVTSRLATHNPADTFNVDGRLELADGAAYPCRLEGAENDRVDVAGDVLLNEQSELEFAFGGSDPFKAGTYTLLTSSGGEDGIAGKFGVVGDLGAYVSDDPADEREAGLKYTRDVLTLKIDYDLLPGDANLDGIVNANDLNALALSWQESDAVWSGGDFTGDGVVNASDLNVLAINWQETIPVAASTSSIPEPTGFAILAMGVCSAALLLGNRRG